MEDNHATHGINLKDKIGYALGDTAGLLTFGLIGSFQNEFYTDVLRIDTKHIRRMVLIARLWDAINDPLWGSFIDSRKPTKHGRFRPYILGAAFPLAIAAVLMYLFIPNLTPTQYLIYAYVTYIFYGMMYTGTNIPYGSLASVITDDEGERSSLSMWRSIGAGLGGLPAQMILPLIAYQTVTTESGEVSSLKVNTFTMFVIGLAVLSVLVYYLHFRMTKERVLLPPKQNENKYNVKNSLKQLVRNKPFIVLCVVSMLLIAYQLYTQATYKYLFKHFYNKPGLNAFVTVFTYLPMAMFIPFMGKIIKRFGKKEICSYGLLFAAVVNVVMYLLRFTSLVNNPYIFLALLFLSGAGQTFLVLEVWALVMDVIDYHELRSGRREEGTAYACYSFMRKVGQTIAGYGLNFLLSVIHYNTEAGDTVKQDPEVLKKLFDISTIVPAIMLILMFVLLMFVYSLSKKRLAQMHDEMKAAEQAAETT